MINESDHEATSRICVLLDYLNERQVDMEGLAEQKRIRLQQCVHLRNFEIEATQVGLCCVVLSVVRKKLGREEKTCRYVSS